MCICKIPDLGATAPKPGATFAQTEKSLSESPEGRGGKRGNLLHDPEIIRRGGTKSGWLLCYGQARQLGLSPSQQPAVKVSFKDAHDNEYWAVYPPKFETDFFND